MIEKINKLIQQGDDFTWEKCRRPAHGTFFGKVPSAEWNTWVSRIEQILSKTVKQNSEPLIHFKTAKSARIEGNGKDEFDIAKDGYVGALKSLKSLIKEGDAFDELLLSNKKDTSPIVPQTETTTNHNKKKVFIVHGHDHNLKIELEVFLSHIGLKPIVLHREADEGKTIIEKFESNSDVAYVFILLTL